MADEKCPQRNDGRYRPAIREAWIAILGHDDFTDEESFFDVGGHSLRGILLMAQLEAIYSVPLPIALLFDHQSVVELADALVAVL